MPFSVYIAMPPAGGGYPPNVYKVGKTTEEDVGSRVAALNDSGSNYPTANGENWDLVDHFSLANAEQMDAFETAMASGLGTGLDPRATGQPNCLRVLPLRLTFTLRRWRASRPLSRVASLMLGP